MSRLGIRVGVGHFPGQDAAVCAIDEVVARVASGFDVPADVRMGEVVMLPDVGTNVDKRVRLLLLVVDVLAGPQPGWMRI